MFSVRIASVHVVASESSAPVSYTQRQLHGLHAMGIVAWTCGGDALAVPASFDSKEPRHAPLAFDQLPASLEATAQWLVNQPLVQMPYRGANVACVGPEQACLLVVCLHSDSTVQTPLSSDGAQLFELMMRAIEMQRSEQKQCAISTRHSAGLLNDTAPVCLDDILLPQTRAVLLLDPRPDAFANDDVIDKVLLPGSSLPLWRTPHPELLLATPLLKRCAWESLKGLRRMLNSVMRP